jgi:hypothetical protein
MWQPEAVSGFAPLSKLGGAGILAGMADTPQFLYRIVPTRADMLASGPTEHEMQVMAIHFAHLQKLAG